MEIKYYGHAAFSVNVNNITLLFDPFISGNPLTSGININSIKADYILISHGHQDHILDAEKIAKNNNATVISNFEIVNWLLDKGIKKGHHLNIGGGSKFDFGYLTYFNAVHSSVLPDGTCGGSPGSFIIESDKGSFFFAGDTGLFYDMKLIGDYKKINLAFLPIGGNFTMGIDDAVIASDFIKCNKIIGMHYNTFPYITIDKNQAVKKFSGAGKELILPGIGETINI